MSITPAPMALAPSPYLHFGADTFVVRDQEVLPVFQADHGRVVLLPVAVAEQLAGGSVAPGAPGHAQCGEMGLAGTDVAQFRTAYLDRLGEDDPAGQRHFVLLPTSYCNMGCEYCGQTHTKQSLAPDHRDAVSARVLAAAGDDAVREVHVAWFGGEPLMAYAVLRQMARGFVEAFDQAGKTYTSKITTNGALLDDRKLRTMITDLRIHRLDITLDGPAHVHDLHRPLKSGLPTFDRLTQFLARAVREEFAAPATFVLRTNVDRKNAEYVPEYLRTMADLGFGAASNVVFQLSPIHAWSNDISDLALDRRGMPERELEWLELMQELGLKSPMLPSKVVTNTCVATNPEAEVIDASGNVFSCTEHPLVEATSAANTVAFIADLDSLMRRPRGQFDDWHEQLASPAQQCSSCKVLPVCGGCCPKQWDDGVVPCPTFKSTIPQRLSLLMRGRGHAPARAWTEAG